MDALQSLCDGFKQEVNYKKQSAWHLLRETTGKLTFKLKNTNIENVKEFKYHRVIMSKNNCSFQPNLKELSKKRFEGSFCPLLED